MEAKIRDPGIGPKRRNYYEQLIEACADQDPMTFFQRFDDLDRRTCGLWVDQFTLEFKRVKAGQWLYRQEIPGLLSKTLKIYELTVDAVSSSLWTLSETRVPMQGAKEKPVKTVWSWKKTLMIMSCIATFFHSARFFSADLEYPS